MTHQAAQTFAHHWLTAWNSHDLDAIMDFYADDVSFNSPFVTEMGIDPKGNIAGKENLRPYFRAALDRNTTLHFDLQQVFAGSHSVVMYYTRMNKSLAAEFVELDKAGKIIRSRSHYAPL